MLATPWAVAVLYETVRVVVAEALCEAVATVEVELVSDAASAVVTSVSLAAGVTGVTGRRAVTGVVAAGRV